MKVQVIYHRGMSSEDLVAGESTTNVPWLSTRELRSWLALSALMEALPPTLSAQLKRDNGLNGFDYMVMAGLSEAPGRASLMGDLATFVAGSISRLSHALSRMEEKGWVVRQPFCDDGRQMQVILTDAGMAKVEEAAPGHVRQVRQLVLDPLGPEKVDQLGEIAADLLRVVNPAILRTLEGLYPEESD